MRASAARKTEGSAARRGALLRLLAQPSDRERRPCAGCTLACACARRSSLCCCGCSAGCKHAPRMLARDPGRSLPVHPVFVRMIYELAVLRVVTAYWPTSDRYARFSGGADASVLFTTSSLEHADLLAHHVAYRSIVGRLRTGWRVVLAPHLAGASAPTLAIEPAEPDAPLDALAHDLQGLGDGLARSVRRLARTRLFCLDPMSSGASPAQLSGREREVLDLFLAGLSTASIARRLFISPNTVRNHLKHVCGKLGVRSQRQLREAFAASME